MASYLISYDLNKPGQNYSDLYDAIKKVGSTWWHCLDSTWIVKSTKSAAQIRDALLPCLDKNDRILVVITGREAAWNGFDQICSDWLRNNLEGAVVA